MAVVLNYLSVIGADKDEAGAFLLTNPAGGPGPSSFMGMGDELCITAGVCYQVGGVDHPLVANMTSTLGEGAGRGLSCVVIC